MDRGALVTGVPFAADLATRDGNRDAVAATLERFGRLDLLVPNAGFQHVAPVTEFDEDRWDGLLAILLTSPFLLAKHAWRGRRVRRPRPAARQERERLDQPEDPMDLGWTAR